ncbi:hypothetical protein JXA70_03220 [candidate division KSB1 bacterium]|nr:hypothetical protein [candidate division KSB1 bacterium]
MYRKMSPKKKQPKPIQSELSPARKRLYTLITLLIPVLFFLFLEIGLRIANYGGDTRLFVPTPSVNSPYFGLNQNVGRRYFYRDEFTPTPRKDLFLQQKPENGYRIFVLGGSTTAGFPYGNNLTFPRILQRRLIDLFPEKHIEVVNCAFTAINTYTLLDYMDEVLQQQPDLILVYAGHNEYYGALGVASMESVGRSRWLVKTYLNLQHLKIFLWVRNSFHGLRAALSPGAASLPQDPTRTIMARIVRDKKIPYGSRLYQSGLDQFRGNMQDIIKKANKADVPIILSELVSNVRDHRPFVSIKTDDFPPALSEYEAGRNADAQADFAAAKDFYYRAKDYDALRFRASEDMNSIIHELAEMYETQVVPMKKFFEAASPNGLIGENVMWEHLHPKSNGYFLMADAFFETIRANGFIVSDWSTVKYPPADYYEQNWGLTKLDSVHAELSILQLKGGWPFMQDGTPNLFMTHFKPQSAEEQIVFDVIALGEGTLEQGHLKLAAEYEKNREYVKAFHEYKALIYTVPTLDLFYEPMIQLLINMREYHLALRVLFEALRYQDTAFVYKWIGQIYLVLDETERGIRFLQQALKREPNDDQVVYNITRAYYAIGRFQEGDALLKKLQPRIGATREFQELIEFRQIKQQEFEHAER